MDFRQAFGTSRTAEVEGVWVEIAPGVEVLVARAQNPKHKAAVRRLLAPHKLAIRNDTLADEVVEPLLARAAAEGVLLDWRGVVLDGEEVPYSQEAAVRMLSEFPDFRDTIDFIAGQRATYQTEYLEAGK